MKEDWPWYLPVCAISGIRIRGTFHQVLPWARIRDKMLLVIDAGNSNIVIGVFEGVELLHSWRVSTHQE